MRRALLILAGVLVLASVVSVAIHLAPVRAALGMKPLGAGDSPSAFCPFGYGATPAPRTARPIPTTPRPALGFTLDVTTRDDITAWAATQSVRCTSMRGGTTLECAGVRAMGALPATVWFRFVDDTLAGIQTTRRSDDAASVATAFRTVETTMTSTVGAPSVRRGDTETLDAGALRQAMVEYRAPAYRATVRATNMGDGYVLTESYAN